VIVGSAVIGTIATVVTRAEPGSVLGLFVLAGTVAAALTVQPRTGRLIFPVPALCYVIGALVSGVVYERSANKTELAVGAAQWIANGFFVMVLSTLLAIALTTVRWFMWRRDQRGPVPPVPPDWPAAGQAPVAPQRGGSLAEGADPRWTGPRPEAVQPQVRPGSETIRPGPQRPPRAPGWDQRPGTGPYNFSSGA
jgi:hypothetical protein